MRIAVTAQEGTGDFHFAGAPWDVFKVTLESCGHQVVSVDSNPDFLIMNNFSRKLQRKSGLTSKESQVLVVWEPPSNKPQNFYQKNLSRFGCVYFPSPIWVQKYGGKAFMWPQGSVGPQNQVSWGDRINQFCFIQANRWSLYPGERYSFRREVLRSLNEDIAIFGSRWNKGLILDILSTCRALINRRASGRLNWSGFKGIGYLFLNYNGVTKNKIETMGKYKFSLVIENSNEYVSEKLIDAILAKTVPLYVGVDLEKCGLPAGIAFCCDAEINSISDAMVTLKSNPKLCATILENGEQFVKSKKFIDMENEVVLQSLARDICRFIDAK